MDLLLSGSYLKLVFLKECVISGIVMESRPSVSRAIGLAETVLSPTIPIVERKLVLIIALGDPANRIGIDGQRVY